MYARFFHIFLQRQSISIRGEVPSQVTIPSLTTSKHFARLYLLSFGHSQHSRSFPTVHNSRRVIYANRPAAISSPLSTRRLSLHHTMSASNPQLIVLFCIIGAASSVTIGFAVSRLFGRNSEDDTAPNTMRRAYDEQILYMRDVRIQNRMLAEQEARGGRSADRYAKRPGEIVNEVARYS